MRSWKVDLLTPSAGNFIYFHANRNSGWADSEKEKQRERERLPPEYTCWRTTAKGKITFNSFLCMKAWGRESDNGQTIFKITGKRQRWNQKMNIPQRQAFLSPSSLPSVPSVFFYLDPLRIKLYFVVTEKHKTPFTEWRTVRSTSNREDVTGINHSDFSFFLSACCLLMRCNTCFCLWRTHCFPLTCHLSSPVCWRGCRTSVFRPPPFQAGYFTCIRTVM